MAWAIGIGLVLLLLLAAASVSHWRWLGKQSPVGVWIADINGTTVTLEFEGGPREGTYKRLFEGPEGPKREFGHWAARRQDLQMLIMASEQENHPEFGLNTRHTIMYRRPDAISIAGPDLQWVKFELAPKGTTLNFEQNSFT